MQDMYHIPVNSVLAPQKSESIDYMNVVPPSFNVVSAPLNTGTNTVLCSNGTNVVALFAGTAGGAISADGINWSAITLPVSGTWSAVAWGNSIFLATDSASKNLITSPDGVNWTLQTGSPLTNGLSCAFGNGKFLITQTGSATLCYTTNATSFTTASFPSSANWTYLAYAATSALWMAVVPGTTTSASSPDGVTWTARAMTTAGAWSCIASNGSGFVVLTNDGSGAVNSSASGTSWVAETWDTDYYQGVAWGNSTYLGVASNSGDSELSSNGTSFTYGAAVPGTHACAICYHAPGTTWVVVQTGLATVYVSTNNGTTWTTSSLVATPFTCGAYGNGTFVALCSNGSSAYLSATGFTWRAVALPLSGIAWASVTWGYDKFVALPVTGNQAMYSYNGVEWFVITLPVSLTAGATAIFGNGQWVAVGATAAQGMYSVDGTRWVLVSAAAAGAGQLAFGGNLFVAVFSGTATMSATASPSSGTARAGAMSSSTTWSGVAFGRNVFVAVNTTNASAYSNDGLKWYAVTLPVSQTWFAVTYAFGNFLAFASNGNTMLVSADGRNWRAFTLPVTGVLSDAIVGKNSVVVLGSDGTILASNDINGTHYGNIA